MSETNSEFSPETAATPRQKEDQRVTQEIEKIRDTQETHALHDDLRGKANQIVEKRNTTAERLFNKPYAELTIDERKAVGRRLYPNADPEALRQAVEKFEQDQ